jgi:cation:H+ antiporter
VPSKAPLWLDLVGLFGSLVVLAVSGDQFVIALARISASVRVRPTVAAALVGGLGTSIAELIVAGVAAAKSPALAIGSLVGSIVANVCLALAAAALIIPLKVDSATVRREAPISVASVVLFAVLAVGVSRWPRASSCWSRSVPQLRPCCSDSDKESRLLARSCG